MYPTSLRALLLSLFALSAFASTPYQVVDLKGVPDTVPSSPRFLTAVNDVALFFASRSGTPADLWRTDGTPDGTFVLKTFAPDDFFGSIVSNGTIAWFAVRNSSTSWSLWRSDGRTIVAVQTSSTEPIVMIATLGGKAFALYGHRELRVIDESHTESLGVVSQGTSSRFSAARSGDILYVGTDIGIWKTDGTPANTTKISPNAAYALTIANGRLFYGGTTLNKGTELWVSDGTNAGNMVADLSPGQGSTFGPTSAIGAVGDRVLFTAYNNDLISSDGSESGTSVLRHDPALPRNSVFVPFQGALYFNYMDRLWRSDGTAAGTQLAVDTKPANLLATTSRMFFVGNDPQHGRSLFSSDGTAAGTRWIANASGDLFTTTSGGSIFFAGDDPYYGGEPWISDGTAAGSHLIANLAGDGAGSSRPRNFIAGADRLYFTADGDSGSAIWWTDGTASGTQSIIHAGTSDDLPPAAGVVGNTLYLRRSSQLTKTVGTTEALVHDFRGDFLSAHIGDSFAFGDRLYFFVDQGQLFVTDGTDAGTLQVMEADYDVLPLISSAGQPYLIETFGTLWAVGPTPRATHTIARVKEKLNHDSALLPFAGSFFYFGSMGLFPHLWNFSGGANDATLVKVMPRGGFGGDTGYGIDTGSANIGSALLFAWRGERFDEVQLWKTDGTADGTAQITEFSVLYAGLLTPLVALGERVLFAVDNGRESFRPWVSDGTKGGTKILAEITPMGGSRFNFFVADGIAYFAANGGLWQTDGTQEGTKAIAGVSGLTGTGFARVGNTLYFAAATKEQGIELWAYPLPGPGAVTIDDLRVSEHDGNAAVMVRLTRSSNQRVTVSYETVNVSATAGRDYTPASGTLTFEAGEVTKTIAIGIKDDDLPGRSRAFLVRLKGANVPIEKTTASVAIDDESPADVELAFLPTSPARFELRNHGPSPASNVVLCYDPLDTNSFQYCKRPIELTPGETQSFDIGNREGIVAGWVTQWERDPVPANNASVWRQGVGRLFASPPTLHAGESGTIAIALPAFEGVAFSSSDPSVLRGPDSVTGSADHTVTWATFTGLKPGTATVTAQSAVRQTVDMQVVAAGEVIRAPVKMAVGYGFNPYPTFGFPWEVRARIDGATADGATPSGTVEFFEDGISIGTAPVGREEARLVLSKSLPGYHLYRGAYSGDSRFNPATAEMPWTVSVSKGMPSFSATSLGGPEVVIGLRGVDGYPPTGTITVSENGSTRRTAGPLAKSGPGTATSTATGFSAAARTVQISYSGDELYESASVTIPITGIHRHSSGR